MSTWNDPEAHDGGPTCSLGPGPGIETEDWHEALEEALLGCERSRRYVERLTGKAPPLLSEELPRKATWRRGLDRKPLPEDGAEAWRAWSSVTVRLAGRIVLRSVNPSDALDWAHAQRREAEAYLQAASKAWDEHVDRVTLAARGGAA